MSVPTTQVHRETAREAGLGTLSPISILAGVVTAYGAFAIVAAIVGSIITAVDADTEFRTDDWAGSGAVAALATAVVLFLAYLFGGYVAGRMARRAGGLHGFLVFLLSLVVGAVVGGAVSTVADGDEIESNLRSIGIPTTTDQVTDVAVAAVIVSLIAVLVGSMLGGRLGERWHTKLARRVVDPEIGPAAGVRARADREEEERFDHIERDEPLRRDLSHQDRALDEDDDGDVDLREDDDDDGVVDLRDEPRYSAAEWQAREEIGR